LIRAAAKQCGRSRLPVLYPPAPLGDVLNCLRQRSDLLLMAAPQEAQAHLSACVAAAKPMRPGLLIGPEGGFTGPERERARQVGASLFSWGERTLRTDTASSVFAAIVLYEAEQAQGIYRGE
jgi:16S rRNA (uracil1498-N3)-methyltransferase